MSSYDLIIFDCDGTLVDSHDMYHTIMAKMVNRYSELSYTRQIVEQDYLGIDYSQFFEIISEKEHIVFPENIGKLCIEEAKKKLKNSSKRFIMFLKH